MTEQVLDGYVTKQELADQLRVGERTVRRWCNQPDGLPFVTIGAQRLFNVQRVRAWVASRERSNPTHHSAREGRATGNSRAASRPRAS